MEIMVGRDTQLPTTDEIAWFEDKSKWEKLTSFGMVETERLLVIKSLMKLVTIFQVCPIMQNNLEMLPGALGY